MKLCQVTHTQNSPLKSLPESRFLFQLKRMTILQATFWLHQQKKLLFSFTHFKTTEIPELSSCLCSWLVFKTTRQMPDSKDQSRSWILQIFKPHYYFIATSPRPLRSKQYSLNSLAKQTCGCCREETERVKTCKKWTSQKVKKFQRLPQKSVPG